MVSKVNAQVVWNTASTGSVNVLACGDVPTTITVGMTNISGSTIADGQMILDLPPGLLYVPGTLTSVSGPAVSEFDINNLNAPVISVGDLAAGQTVDFTFGVKTFDCTTYNHVVGGGLLQNVYTFSWPGGSPPAHTTPAYQLQYASLSYNSITNANFNGTHIG